MQQTIINYIEQELLQEPLEDGLTTDEDLLTSGLLDSLSVMNLVSFLEEKFQLAIPPEDLTLDNFMTVDAMTSYLQELQKQK
ncbi:MAG: acyl carrier protein [Saprospiraceae bacterium]